MHEYVNSVVHLYVHVVRGVSDQYQKSEDQIRNTRCMLLYLLHLDLFYSSTLDLFNTQANADAVPVPTPIPVCINCRTCIHFN